LGLCPELTLFEKINSLKGADGGNVEKNQRRNLRDLKKKARRVGRIAEKAQVKWVRKKTHWNSKRTGEGIDRKEVKIRRGRKT
jgi:hypothetical protein